MLSWTIKVFYIYIYIYLKNNVLLVRPLWLSDVHAGMEKILMFSIPDCPALFCVAALISWILKKEGRKEGKSIFIWQSIQINWWYLQYNNFSLGDHH